MLWRLRHFEGHCLRGGEGMAHAGVKITPYGNPTIPAQNMLLLALVSTSY
jgi:hypothetical protein